MWKQRDEAEVKEIRQRKRDAYKKIWRPFISAVFLFLVLSILEKIGFNRASVPMLTPITWGVFFEKKLLKAFLFGLFMFVVIYTEQIVSKRSSFSKSEAMVCLKCNKYKNNDKNYKCDCGGEFVPLDELDWVDEEKASSKNAD